MSNDLRVWNPAMELMPAEEMRALQLEKLRRQVARVYDQSPYYREKFGRAGVHPGMLNSFDDYSAFPFFDKDEERISQAQSKEELGHCLGMHITCDPRLVNRISSTSGTTGSPTFTGFTRKDRLIQAENGARGFYRAGMRQGDVVLHASVLSMWMAGLPFCDMLLEYGACLVPVGALSGVERVAQVARETRPTFMLSTVSYAEHLIKSMPAKCGIEARELGIKTLIVYGEPGGSIAEVRDRLSAGFGGAAIFDIMGNTGAHSPLSLSCEYNEGLHFYGADNCYFEVVDPVTLQPLPFEQGVEGEVVATGLDKECAPLIRWRDKDTIRISTDPCPCGLPGFRYHIIGRSDDMLLVKGVNVYPHAVKDVLLSFEPFVTGNVRIVKPGPSPVVPPPVRVRVEHSEAVPADEVQALKCRIEEKIHNILRFRATIEMCPPGALGSALGKTHKAQLIEIQQ